MSVRILSRNARLAFAIGAALATTALIDAATPPPWLAAAVASSAKTTDARGVVLLNEFQVRFLPADGRRFLLRRAVKLLSEDARGQMRLGVPFNEDLDQIISAQAWIIHADGTSTEHFGKSDFMTVADRSVMVWTTYRVAAFARLESAREGDVVACEIEVELHPASPDFTASLREELPVLRAVVEARPEKGGSLRFDAASNRFPPPTPLDPDHGLRWEVADLPGIPATLPAGFVPNGMPVALRDIPAAGPDRHFESWGGFVEASLAVVAPRAVPSSAVTAEAKRLAAGATTRWDRIRAVGEAVRQHVRYLSLNLDKDSLAGVRPHFPDDVWRTHLGDCKDKSCLLNVMLHAVGEDSYLVLVNAGHSWAHPPPWPGQIFNHVIVAVPADADAPARWPSVPGGPSGRLILFDPTSEDIPFGLLPPSDRGSEALILATGTTDLIRLPANSVEFANTVRETTVKLEANGDIAVSIDQTTIGEISAARSAARKRLGDARFGDELAQTYHAVLPTLSGFEWKDDWDSVGGHDHLTESFSARGAMHPLGPDRLMIRPQIAQFDHPLRPWKTESEGRLAVSRVSMDETVRLDLPVSFAIEGLPPDLHLEIPGAQARVEYHVDGRTLVYSRSMHREAGFLDRTAYDALVSFLEKVTEAERRTIIARRTTEAPKVQGSN